MGNPAARLNDMHTCPMSNGNTPHVGGPIISTTRSVLINGLPAAKIGDTCVCSGSMDSIVTGSSSVMIEGMPACRLGDSTAHGGKIIIGSTNVLIG